MIKKNFKKKTLFILCLSLLSLEYVFSLSPVSLSLSHRCAHTPSPSPSQLKQNHPKAFLSTLASGFVEIGILGSWCWWWVVAKMGLLVHGGRGSLLEWVHWSMFIMVGLLVWSGGRLKLGLLFWWGIVGCWQ